MTRTTCRACGEGNLELVIDLGFQPPSNALLTRFDQPEKTYPLRAVVCLDCWLMQTDYDVPHEELFNGNYPYFSGGSKEWHDHCARYSLQIKNRLQLDASSYVIEVGGNDGTLLQHFQCDTLNVEPSANVARESMAKNIPTLVERFQNVTGNRHGADLIIANNVLAHDPDLNGFAAGIARNLARKGTCTIEFPWVLKLLQEGQFDTIYHEHYSYFSITALDTLLFAYGLKIYDAEYLDIHGGSIRAYVKHVGHRTGTVTGVTELRELEAPLLNLRTYEEFKARAHLCATDFREFLRTAEGNVYGAGAAAKAAVFTNFVGITHREIPFIGDVTPAKLNKLLPGSRIPIVTESTMLAHEPDFIVIFPWNWREEIAAKYRAMGYEGKFVVAIPRLEIF